METIRAILMNSAAEDLSILSIYNVNKIKSEFTGDSDSTKRYIYVNELVVNLQLMGQSFFCEKMEYGDMVRKLAENMEINFTNKAYIGVDELELAIVKKYILKNLVGILAEQKQALWQIICRDCLTVNLSNQAITKRLMEDLPELINFRVLTWVADANLQGFLGKTREWDDQGVMFFGRREFRHYVIYPVFYIAMLRHKYRDNQIPKCCDCGAGLVSGAKFCNECGAKLR